jgi:ketosteroid isomerase-like protein
MGEQHARGRQAGYRFPREARVHEGERYGQVMPASAPEVISNYFEADARRDVDAILVLFTDDAVVVDEGETWRGIDKIRAWREGPASKYNYTTEVFRTDRTGENEYLVTGRLEGNFPGGTVELKWRFTVADDRIRRMHIAP